MAIFLKEDRAGKTEKPVPIRNVKKTYVLPLKTESRVEACTEAGKDVSSY